MTTLSANNPMTTVPGSLNHLPVIASDIIYEGAAVGDNGAGYVRPLSGGDAFRGFAPALDAVVEGREVRREKHPGRDDAHFLTLRTRGGGVRVVCVGRDLWEASPPGTALAKPAWSRRLVADGRELTLPAVPREAAGALCAFPLAVALAAVLILRHLLRR